jgi:hypothetical protein
MRRGELIAGRYELVERLGRGGMGEVWAGRDRDLRRDVAVKLLVLDEAAHPDLAPRFDREAVAAAQINHPNVVALYDRGAHEGVLFLVMEKVDGVSLAERIRGQGPMDPRQALPIADGICEALAAAHEAGVVHYDIKPHNVMLAPGDRVKVVDFGTAGFVRAAFTVARSSQLVPAGTVEYGAPEQFLAERGDERSDLYALGGVLFAMLTGGPPFTGHNALAVLRRKLDEDAPRLDVLRPDLPPALTDLVAELLDRDPARRPESARRVRQRLRALPVPPGITVPRRGTPGSRVTGAGGHVPGDEMPTQEADGSVARDARRPRRLAAAGTLAVLAALAGLLAWAPWSSPGSARGAEDTRASRATTPAGAPPGTPGSSPPDTGRGTPESWNSSGTDRTPFTGEALLPQRFSTSQGIEFARMTSEVRPCDQVASSKGPLDPADVAKVFADHGCTRVMTGVYLEQPGPNATPDNPVLVSVMVFAFADTATATTVYDYLNGPARWNLTTWCTPTGVGSKPCDSDSQGFRWQWNRVDHRYVITAVSQRTDLTTDGTIRPWLETAAGTAANSSGPQNYHGR